MIVLGIDPGSRRMGYGVIERDKTGPCFRDAGLLDIRSATDTAALAETQASIRDLLARWQPDLIAVEKLFLAKNRTTGMAVAQARGVILAACAGTGAPIAEYTPNEIKLGLTGYGGADKKAVAKMVRMILRQPELRLIDDAMDALGLAIFASGDRRR